VGVTKIQMKKKSMAKYLHNFKIFKTVIILFGCIVLVLLRLLDGEFWLVFILFFVFYFIFAGVFAHGWWLSG
jgi:hypothetical protein